MTMPYERTRALRWAGEFLREVRRSDKYSEEIRRQAHVILRHYPEALDIAYQSTQYEPHCFVLSWLGPENSHDGGGGA